MIYTVSEIAKILNIAPSTIRYYDKEGLLPAVERSRGGIRIFTERDLGWLRMISCLKSTGMPLKEIKRYFDLVEQGDATLEERLHIFTDHHQRVLQEIEELQHYLEKIEWKIDYLKHAEGA